MRCKGCGHDCEEGALQCPNCGRLLVTEAVGDPSDAASEPGGIDPTDGAAPPDPAARTDAVAPPDPAAPTPPAVPLVPTPPSPAVPPAPVPPAPVPPVRQAPGGVRYGWRLTLPNHEVVPLDPQRSPQGQPMPTFLGRGARVPEGIREVLQYFNTVNLEHVALGFMGDDVRVSVLTNTNPVARLQRNADGTIEWTPLAEKASFAVHAGDSTTLWLGQCCFVKIDRGHA